MNADKRRLKRIGLSVFIGVNRRLKMPFSDFFSSLLGRGLGRAGLGEALSGSGLAESASTRHWCASNNGTVYLY
jgi:hypothetical protein